MSQEDNIKQHRAEIIDLGKDLISLYHDAAKSLEGSIFRSENNASTAPLGIFQSTKEMKRRLEEKLERLTIELAKLSVEKGFKYI